MLWHTWYSRDGVHWAHMTFRSKLIAQYYAARKYLQGYPFIQVKEGSID